MSAIRSPISAAVAGLGRAGWDLHFQPLLSLPGFKIVAVADPLPERCREAAALAGCRQFSTTEELLKEVDSEIVVVATPTFTHYSDAVRVLQAGRHCILEKPMAMSFAEARQLLALARSKGRGLFVHHTYLHRAEYHHLRKVIESGVLGPLFHLRTFWGSYQRRWDWQTLRKNGGGQLCNRGAHVLSIVLPLLGSPVRSVYAELRNIKDAGDAEDHIHLVLQTEGNVSADIVVSSAIALSSPKWMLCGTTGTLLCDGERSRIRYYDASKVPARSVLDAAAPDRKYAKEALPWEEKEIPVEPPPVKSFHENVLDVLLHQGTAVVTPESAVEVMRVLDLARLSARGE